MTRGRTEQKEARAPWFYRPGIPMRPGLPGSERYEFEMEATYVRTTPPDETDGPSMSTILERCKRAANAGARPNPKAPVPQQLVYPIEIPVHVPVQVPVHIPVPTPVMYMPHARSFPIIPCQCPCCLNNCPGPEAHRLVYQNHHHHHAATPSKAKQAPKREKLNRILESKRFPQSNSFNEPLIDVSIEPMTYFYDRYDRKQLDELATTPALQEMKIVHTEFPWEVIVRSKDTRGVTIRDVLDSIWNELNITVTEKDANKMRGHWLVMRYRDQTSDAKRTGDRYAGLKRMHWMRLKNHNLLGLESYKTDKWLMVFEKDSEQ